VKHVSPFGVLGPPAPFLRLERAVGVDLLLKPGEEPMGLDALS
jgi:hypothetical protein